MNTIKAAIFDLDGTLVDSMWVWERIDMEFLKKRGYTVPENLKDNITHLSFKQVAQYFKTTFSIDDSVEAIMDEWHEMAYNEYSNNVFLKEGAMEYLHSLKKAGIKIALATSNSKPLLEATLKNNGIYDLFDSITVTDEVKKGKDNPDIYLLAAEKLNVNPVNCMVYEDIVAAVGGAKLAGMNVTAVYDKASEKDLNILKEKADKYIYSYKELL